jgi:FkbM family methyltransferase
VEQRRRPEISGAAARGVPSLVGRDLGVRLVSFSQNAEDVRLWRVFNDTKDGFYVDVGANHPVTGSVTKLFYDAGWSGINIEPGPTYDLLAAARPRDINIRAAIGRSAGHAAFWLTYPETGLSTARPEVHDRVPELIEQFEQVTVQCLRLEDVLEAHASGRAIHFLKIDVEGSEADVISSNDWRKFRPVVLIVEAVATMDSTPTHDAWEPQLLAFDYELAAFDGLNRFYVASEHRDLVSGLGYPIGVLDHYVSETQFELERQCQQLKADLDRLRAATDAQRAELIDVRAQLTAVLRSHTWRAGRALWWLARPLRLLDRWVRGLPK